MTSTTGDEVPFLAGMERKEEQVNELHAATERLGKAAFSVHGIADAAKSLLSDIKNMVSGMRSERGPDPDARIDSDDDDLARIVRIVAKYGAPRQEYHEAPRGDNGVKTVVVSVGVALLIAGILGGLALSNQFAAFKAQVTEWQIATNHRLDRLEAQRP